MFTNICLIVINLFLLLYHNFYCPISTSCISCAYPLYSATVHVGQPIHSSICVFPRFLDLWTRDHGLAGEARKNMKLICEYIIAVYYKQWFAIKKSHKLTDGARHMLKQVKPLASCASDM